MSTDAIHDPPCLERIVALRPDMAAAAQTVYDAWEQDQDGHDEDLGVGGICDGVAAAMIGVLDEACPGIDATTSYVEVTTHVEIVARLREGVHRIDIHPNTYETGFGYVWRKKPDVTLVAEDVTIDLLDRDPSRYEDYSGGDMA